MDFFTWQVVPEWLELACNDATARHAAYRDAASQSADDLDFPLQTLLLPATASFADYHTLADALGARWQLIATVFWRLRAERPIASTDDLLAQAFAQELQHCCQQATTDLGIQHVALRVVCRPNVWELRARVPFVALQDWLAPVVPTAGFLVAAAARDECLYIIRSWAAYTVPVTQAARVLPSDALARFKAQEFYTHPVAKDLPSAEAILALWDRWVDATAPWMALRCGAGGVFRDDSGQPVTLPSLHFDGLVGTRRDGRHERIRDYQRYRYRQDLPTLEVIREDRRVALLYP